MMAGEAAYKALSAYARPIFDTITMQTAALQKLIGATRSLPVAADQYIDWVSHVNVTKESLEGAKTVHNELLLLREQMSSLVTVDIQTGLAGEFRYLTPEDCSLLNASANNLAETLNIFAGILAEDINFKQDTTPINSIRNILIYVRVIDSLNDHYSTGVITKDVFDKSCNNAVKEMCGYVSDLSKVSANSIESLSEVNTDENTSAFADSSVVTENLGLTDSLIQLVSESAYKINIGDTKNSLVNKAVVMTLCTLGTGLGVYLFSKGILNLTEIDANQIKEVLKTVSETVSTANDEIVRELTDIPEEVEVDNKKLDTESPLKT